MKTSISLASVTAMALFALPVVYGEVHYAPGGNGAILSALKLDPEGIIRLGDDGVLRSFDSRLAVVDYRNLDPAQIQAWLLQSSTADVVAANELVVSGVDGRTVSSIDDLLNPSPASKPAPLVRTMSS